MVRYRQQVADERKMQFRLAYLCAGRYLTPLAIVGNSVLRSALRACLSPSPSILKRGWLSGQVRGLSIALPTHRQRQDGTDVFRARDNHV
jgi:hypothetical protein